jgi:hypothetical protein
MSQTLKQIRDVMEKMGIPGRDGYDLPTSDKSFADGAKWRIEIAGVERASTMEAMLDEASKRNVVVHRVVATVGGSTYCDFEELKAMAKMARDAQIEVVMVVGHRKAWDPGAREGATHEGAMQGMRLRGSDNVSYHIADMMRNIEAGFRGFLVYDEGVLTIVNQMRQEGLIPQDTVFKFSVFGGYCNAAGAKVVQGLGANSLNPLSDVSLPILSSIRKAVDIPLDVYVIIVDSFGGMYRAYETPEIARVASPVYFKIEPGTSEGDIYKPWAFEGFHDQLIREKVKVAQVIQELMERHAPELKTSSPGAKDLILPQA